jgi:hypothetical protein
MTSNYVIFHLANPQLRHLGQSIKLTLWERCVSSRQKRTTTQARLGCEFCVKRCPIFKSRISVGFTSQMKVSAENWITLYIKPYKYSYIYMGASNLCTFLVLAKKFDFPTWIFHLYTLQSTVLVKNGVFWDVTPCGSCKNRSFGGI